MTNMNSKQREMLKPFVMAKQGGIFCVECGKTREQLMNDGKSGQIDIDHIDNNNNHNELENLQFLCHSCNTKKNHPSLEEPQQRVMTPEMAMGRSFEKRFRRWVNGLILVPENNGLLEYNFLVNSGAEHIQCSPETIKRYLKKMTSEQGMYDWIERDTATYLGLKEEYLL
jgi:hypothetical protein